MPTGSIREYADATGHKFRTVYRHIENGTFTDPDAEVIEETRTVYRIRWRQRKNKYVNS